MIKLKNAFLRGFSIAKYFVTSTTCMNRQKYESQKLHTSAFAPSGAMQKRFELSCCLVQKSIPEKFFFQP